MTNHQQIKRLISNLEDVINNWNDPDTASEFLLDAPDIRRVLMDTLKNMESAGR